MRDAAENASSEEFDAFEDGWHRIVVETLMKSWPQFFLLSDIIRLLGADIIMTMLRPQKVPRTYQHQNCPFIEDKLRLPARWY